MRNTVEIKNISQNELVAKFVAYFETETYAALLHSHADKFRERAANHNNFEILAGFGALSIASTEKLPALKILIKSLTQFKDWHMGFLGYDVKNEIEKLTSGNFDGLHFPEMFFFIPRYVLEVNNDRMLVHYHVDHDNQASTIKWIEKVLAVSFNQGTDIQLPLIPRLSKKDYFDRVSKLQHHIMRGDIYEINFCQEFYNKHLELRPATVFQKLIKNHPAPFSTYLKINDKHILSSSPERFVMKQGSKILSQPMKGTIRRSNDIREDFCFRDALKNSLKERSENIMIVDLVRNDLSRICRKGSVVVDELCGIYDFPTVYQMISTISGILDHRASLTDVVENMFPMGSMTGAPKIRAMELIEEYESTKRGAYSGALGYITPEGNFDFNVLIRTLLYNAGNKYLSCSVGSAITARSIPEKEYEECFLKLKGLADVI